MAVIEFFRNETAPVPINAEPVIWVTPRERLQQLWEIAWERMFGDSSLPDPVPPPTGGAPKATQAEIEAQISDQDAANGRIREATRRNRIQGQPNTEEELRTGAEQKIVLGAQERVLSPLQNLAAAMMFELDGLRNSRRVDSPSKGRGGGFHDLLHSRSPISEPPTSIGSLGPSRRALTRSGEKSSRVIA